MAPVVGRFLGEVYRPFGEFDGRPIDLGKPDRAAILYKPGMHFDTIAYATAGGSLGVTVLVDPVAVIGPQEHRQAEEDAKQQRKLHHLSPVSDMQDAYGSALCG